MQCSRAVSISHDNLDRLQGHVIANDLMIVTNFPSTPTKRRDAPWQPIMSVRNFIKSNQGINLQNFNLTDKQKKSYGEKVSEIRGKLLDKAHAYLEDNYEDSDKYRKYVEKLAKKVEARSKRNNALRLWEN